MVTEVAVVNLNLLRSSSNHLEISHISGLVGNSWAVSVSEYVSSLAVGEFRPVLPLIHSNAKPLVAEHQAIFDALWARGEPLEERAASLESGTEPPEMETIRDAERAKQTYLSLTRGAKRVVRLLFPTPAAFRRDDAIGITGVLKERASAGVKVRLLVPVDAEVLARLPGRRSALGENLSFRPITRADSKDTVTVLVVDDSASLAIDERDPSQESFDLAFGSAILATREPRVRQNLRLFERIWGESELREAERLAREREESSRKRAELMQDILTHDIRNFNQVARLNAELLGEQLRDRESSSRILAILRAVDGSTRLIERAKKLGGIMAARDVTVGPTSLGASLRRSVLLIRRANPNVKLKLEGGLSGKVLADELLDEVFIYVISNAVKYTDVAAVRIRVVQERSELRASATEPPHRCWKISVSDWGRGIPDSQKQGVFRRYLETSKGSGLGLSIVHALVTDRYGGKVTLKDRVLGDFHKGTTVEVWLPRP